MTTVAEPAPYTPSHIHTPDQRLRIFVSSTLRELADERSTVRATIERLRLTPVMFELGARPHPARDLYRAYLDQSEVFLGIYWESYGWVGPGETVSGLEDEYLLSGDRPKLIYVKASSSRQPALKDLLTRIRDDDQAAYKSFTDADELPGLVADDLAVLLTERFANTERRAAGLRPMTLPVAVTPIIGRAAELSAVKAMFADPDTRLITLVGPGGIGKTRLALEFAATCSDGLTDALGVWFVDLTPVHDPSRVMDVIGAALGIRPEGSTTTLELLIDRLQQRRVLLVLDNFEHVLAAAPELGQLLTACPGLRILVTSRSVLRLRGERELPLTPLSTPGSEAAETFAATADSAAVQLLVERGRQVRPGFALTTANATAVAELCRRLDGIPLALELAAAQLRILSPAQLLARLSDRLDRTLDLTAGPTDLPDRQRTLRSTVEWSHSLLGDAERALLARLSVFSHTWTLDAAEAVGAVDGDVDVFDVLSSLASHSLVSLDESDPDNLSFRMLGMVRAFAAEQLDERAERDQTLTRLTGYLRAFAGLAGTGLQGPDNRDWARKVDSDLEDLLSAIQRAVLGDDADTVIRISAPLFVYWWSRGLLKTMHAFAAQAAALPSAAQLPPDTAALLLWARGMFLVSTGNAAQARPLMVELMAGATDADEPRLRAFGLVGLALTLVQPAGTEAVRLLDEAAAIFGDLEEHWGLAFALSARGQLALQAGDAAAADLLHSEALEAARKIRNEHLEAQLLDLLGLDALVANNLTLARERFTAAADLHLDLLDQEGSAYCLDGFATLALTQGHPEVAARLTGASDHARAVLGLSVWPGVQASADRLRAMIAAALGEDGFATLSAAGRQLQTGEALSFAIGATRG